MQVSNMYCLSLPVGSIKMGKNSINTNYVLLLIAYFFEVVAKCKLVDGGRSWDNDGKLPQAGSCMQKGKVSGELYSVFPLKNSP